MKQLPLFEDFVDIPLQSSTPIYAYPSSQRVRHELQFQAINSWHTSFYSFSLEPGVYFILPKIGCRHSYPSAGIWEFKLDIYERYTSFPVTRLLQNYCSHAVENDRILISMSQGSPINLPVGGELQLSVASCSNLVLNIESVELEIMVN